MKKLLLLLSILSHTSLFAIVTIKPLDIGEHPLGNSGEVTFSWKLNNGNTNTDALSAGIYLQHDFKESLYFIKTSYDYGESLGITYMDKSFIHARRIHKVIDYLDDEVFLQQQSDTFQSLTSRTLGGAGLRLYNGDINKTGRFYIGIGAFYLTEIETGIEAKNYARANIYISYKYALSKLSTFSLVSYYQPRFGDSKDYLQLTTAELTLSFTKSLALKLSVQYNVNNDPAQGVSPFDYAQTTALTYKF